jgi:riboflavin synthase
LVFFEFTLELLSLKIGFLDCAFNSMQLGEYFANSLSQKSFDCAFASTRAPDLLKVPALAKKLLRDCDSVVVFLETIPEDADALLLVEEKLMDVEIASEKLTFTVVVSADEASGEKLKQIAQERLDSALDAIIQHLREPNQLQRQRESTGGETGEEKAIELEPSVPTAPEGMDSLFG